MPGAWLAREWPSEYMACRLHDLPGAWPAGAWPAGAWPAEYMACRGMACLPGAWHVGCITCQVQGLLVHGLRSAWPTGSLLDAWPAWAWPAGVWPAWTSLREFIFGNKSYSRSVGVKVRSVLFLKGFFKFLRE